jgi:hypothetical protein
MRPRTTTRCRRHRERRSTIQTTADQYGHLVPGDAQAAELIRTTLNRAFHSGA